MRTYKRKNVKECMEPIEGVIGLCRLCLEEPKESVPIFANKNDICTVLATRILMCVGYEITREDCLPNAICTECHNKLNEYYEFRKKCDSTYHKLKHHLLAVQARTAKKLSYEQEEQKALLDSVSICPISQSVCPISQSVCPVRQTVSPIDQSVCPIQSVCSIRQSVSPISRSVCPISQSVCPVSQSVSSIIQSVCPIQSVCSISQSISPISQSVCPVSQSACPISQTVCSISHSVTQTVCAVSQSVDQSDSTIAQSHSKDGQLDSTVGQSDCTVSQSDCTVSQSDTSLVSHLVTMSRDQLMLAFEKPLEIVQTELQQNELELAANIRMDGAVSNKNVEDILQEPSQTKPIEVCPDVTEFLCSILVEMGILKREQNELQMTEEYRTIQIETGDGEQITLELVQIEEQPTPTTIINKKTKVKEKAINEVTKQQKNERPRCSECTREFSTRTVLKRHLRTHTGERPFRCASCGLSFTQREVLTRHALVHQPVRPFACPRCPKSFTQRGALAAHARRHAPADRAPVHECTLCPKRFLHASGLCRHMKTHQGHVWQCGACGKRFSDDSALRRHHRLKHEPHQPPQEI